MRNSDLPAMPIPNGADGAPWSISDMGNPGHVFGLTKREYFAGLAMQGVMSADVYAEMSKDDCAKTAVANADALLAELEQEQAK